MSHDDRHESEAPRAGDRSEIGKLPAGGLAEEMIPLLRAKLGLPPNASIPPAAPLIPSSPAIPAQAPSAILAFADASMERAPMRAALPPPPIQLVLFTLDRESFGVPIDTVYEILRVERITRVPDAPPHVRGLMNVRGRLLPIVEIRTLLGLGPSEIDKDARIMMVQVKGRVLGLLVDQVSYVLSVPPDAIQAAPREVFGERADTIHGVASGPLVGDALVIVLDLERILSVQR